MGAAASQPAPRAAAAAVVASTRKKVIQTSIKREDLMQRRRRRVVEPTGVIEMDKHVLHEAERFEETVDKVEFLETDMTAFHATAAGRRATNDGPIRMPTDKTHASNATTLVDDVPGRFTDRQFRELLRLSRESPAQWPVSRLATHFGADEATIQNIVAHCCPPKITPPTTTVDHPIGTWWSEARGQRSLGSSHTTK
ncbi:hypothetical protein H310_00328 [Aphanomyces invadans]|uniref:Uncharacterized protein n=1 Tax=Aphanomyces invadans TaxID=157072 RepID=A0A024UU60_9STRA|nr:hypothetical protein H310_00328 [Aphanomyces invadans]ETW09884.1 hypothetical protein H310_00328 [Aphanomyces invadans]|eukprot:XP_008861295.1 hypothetical protein H310_00328 [Aphanomyces invadans]